MSRASGVDVQLPQVKCRKHQGEVRERQGSRICKECKVGLVEMGPGPCWKGESMIVMTAGRGHRCLSAAQRKPAERSPTEQSKVVRSVRVGGRVRVGARSGKELYSILTFLVFRAGLK